MSCRLILCLSETTIYVESDGLGVILGKAATQTKNNNVVSLLLIQSISRVFPNTAGLFIRSVTFRPSALAQLIQLSAPLLPFRDCSLGPVFQATQSAVCLLEVV